MSPISEARRRANEKWNAKAYDEIKVRVSKGRKEAIQAAASAQGESLNGFVTTAVDERIERLNGTQEKRDNEGESQHGR